MNIVPTTPKAEPVTLPRTTPKQLPHLADLTSIVPSNPAARVPGVELPFGYAEGFKGYKSRPFASKAQWRFWFATHRPGAHAKAHATGPPKLGYRRLPARKGPPTARTVR